MVHLVVLTFASAEYAQSAEVLRHSALRVGRADKVVIRTPEDVHTLRDLGISPKVRGGGIGGGSSSSISPMYTRVTKLSTANEEET